MVMESIGNNQLIYEELLEAVQFQFAQDIAILQKALGERNLSDIKKAAHSLKGASLNMWFNKMAELAIEFELYLDKDHFSELDDLFNDLVLEWEQIQTILPEK
jgi:HPt (histidine-containing phosphotransfer) domain-containing protein